MPIQSFGDRDTQLFFEGGTLGKRVGWQGVKNIVLRKLDMLHYAMTLGDLASPPGNRLEALRGGWKGYYSVRVNDQWRIVFRWAEKGAEEVQVADYH